MKRLIPVLGLVLFLVSPLYGEPPVVHTASGSVRLPGNVPPALSRATRVSGTLAGDTPVTLTIVLNRTDQSGFDAFLRAVQDPSVPNFRHYLSQRELADRFGPTTQAYGAVLEWLQQQGVTLVEGSANRLTIIVRGTRAQTEQAFGVRLNDYRLGDRTFYSNDRGPALPAAIASHVQAVVGLSNLARPVRAHSTYAATQIAQQLRNSRVGRFGVHLLVGVETDYRVEGGSEGGFAGEGVRQKSEAHRSERRLDPLAVRLYRGRTQHAQSPGQ